MTKKELKHYCYKNNDEVLCCHVFDKGLYAGFSVGGVMEEVPNSMSAEWINEGKTFAELGSWMREHGFRETVALAVKDDDHDEKA